MSEPVGGDTPEFVPDQQAADTPSDDFKYAAFISYRRADGSRVAQRLRYRLLEYKLPRGFTPRPLDIYIDRIYERATENFFGNTILPALSASRALILVQTPLAAAARDDGSDNWVTREVRFFRSLPQGKNVWVALAAGEFADPLPADLAAELPNIERVDVRTLGGWLGLVSEHELLKFVGPLHGIPAESMANLRRDIEKRARWRAVRWASAALAIIAALAGLGAIALRQTWNAEAARQRAEEQAIIAESRRLAANAASQLSTNAEASLDLAVQSANVALTDDAINVLRDALPQARLRFRVPEGHGAMSADGKSVATMAADRALVSVWDVATGAKRSSFNSASIDPGGLVFSPDGRQLIARANGQAGASVIAWDAMTGTKLRSFDASRLPPRISHDSRRLVTTDVEHRIHVWDLNTGEHLMALEGHSEEITDLSFSPDDTMIVTASADRKVKLWDVASKTLVRTMTHPRGVRSARFGKSGERIVTASDDAARVWNVRTGRATRTVLGLTVGLMGTDEVVFEAASFGSLGLVVREAHRCTVWNPSLLDLLDRDLKPTIDLPIDNPSNESFCAVSPDGALLATPDALWDLETKERVATFDTGGAGGAVNFSRDGQLVGVARRAETAVWAVGPESPALTLPVKGAQLIGAVQLTMSLSSDGTTGAFAADEGNLSIWNLVSGKKLWEVRAHEQYASDVAFSRDGSRVLTGGNDGKAIMWDARSGVRLREFLGHHGDVQHVAFVPGHDQILTVGLDETARVWDGTTGAQMWRFDRPDGPIYSFAINPSGTRAVLGDSLSVHELDLGTGREWRRLLTPSPVVSQLLFSPSGAYMVSLSGRSEGKTAAVVWETATGKSVSSIEAYRVQASFGANENVLATDHGLINWQSGEAITTVDRFDEPLWSPKQRCVLTKGKTGMQLRDAQTGRVYVTFRIFPDLFPGGLFSEDGSFFLASGTDSVSVFRSESCLSVDNLIATAKRRVLPRP